MIKQMKEMFNQNTMLFEIKFKWSNEFEKNIHEKFINLKEEKEELDFLFTII